MKPQVLIKGYIGFIFNSYAKRIHIIKVWISTKARLFGNRNFCVLLVWMKIYTSLEGNLAASLKNLYILTQKEPTSRDFNKEIMSKKNPKHSNAKTHPCLFNSVVHNSKKLKQICLIVIIWHIYRLEYFTAINNCIRKKYLLSWKSVHGIKWKQHF